MVLGGFRDLPEYARDGMGGLSAVMLPLILAGIGILTSIAELLVKVKDGGDPHHALNLVSLSPRVYFSC